MKRKKLHDDDVVAAKSNVSGPEGEGLEVSRGGRGCLNGRIPGPHKPNGRAATLLTSKWGEDKLKYCCGQRSVGSNKCLLGYIQVTIEEICMKAMKVARCRIRGPGVWPRTVGPAQ